MQTREESFRRSISKSTADSEYPNQDLYKTQFWVLNSIQYDGYPSMFFDDNDYLIYLEGKIYNQDQSGLHVELKALLKNIFSRDQQGIEQLSKWLRETDGEFIVFGWDKATENICLFNDLLGRLPLYYYQTDQEVGISRNLRFLAELIPHRQYDMMSIAQILQFGYSLHQRTYLKGIDRLTPASLLVIDAEQARCHKKTVHIFNFEHKPYRNKSIKENALELARLMRQGVKNRARLSNQNLLSLSGGLDSRTVGAALHGENIPFTCATFIDFEQARQSDLDCAKEIAQTLEWQQQIITLSASTGADFLKLLRIKHGRNYLGISFVLQYAEQLKQQYGQNFTFFYGNGGDRVARDIHPGRPLDTIDELVNYMMSRQQFFSLETLSSLVQIPAADIVDDLRNTLSSYPENNLIEKFIHFEVHGDALTRHIEGDDRFRHYYWTGTPFYSVPFFKYIMGIPDEQKKDFRLYKIFLETLCPEIASIPYANITTSVGSFQHKLFNSIKKIRQWPNPIRFGLRKLHLYPSVAPPTHIHSPHFLECFQKQIQNCEALSNCFNRSVMESILDRHQQYKNMALEMFFTISSIIEDIEDGHSSIEQYLEKDFSVPSGSWNWYRHKPLDNKSLFSL